MAALAKELMAQTGIKLLWGTANLFSHPRYMNGAGLCVRHACLLSVCACVCM